MGPDSRNESHIRANKRVLLRLRERLVEHGAGGVLAYLPEISMYKIEDHVQIGNSLHIQMGAPGGKLIYVTPEGRIFYVDRRMKDTPVTQDSEYHKSFVAPGVFDWDQDIRDGLREPMDPTALDLVRYTCVVKGVADDFDMELPIPAYTDLLRGRNILRKAKAYQSKQHGLQVRACTVDGSPGDERKEAPQMNNTKATEETIPVGSTVLSVTVAEAPAKHQSKQPSVYIAPEQPSGIKDIVSIKDPVPSNQNMFSERALAGPGILEALRQFIAPHLLSQLPVLSTLRFSEHTKGLKYARIRLLIGFLKIGPALSMEVSQRVGNGRHELVDVTYENDIALHRVDLQAFAKGARTKNEFYAPLKYCFQIATDAKLFGFDHDFIPLNRSFVTHLTSVCENWGSYITDTEGSVVHYSDEDKSTISSTRVKTYQRQSNNNTIWLAKIIKDDEAEGERMSDFVVADDQAEIIRIKSRIEKTNYGHTKVKDTNPTVGTLSPPMSGIFQTSKNRSSVIRSGS
ncbi:hypothetical protein CC86DRAFT_413278 [Ophiobolus disseminans]|uniref:Uncharacterized protein n=1 Tax=Ophiobolus disseminans TaxID=1469910 RepID=A0A6A6ZG80_9PLEO|nr:hypothetical protein CC86DRAFT_413278 [Ophiobolus disseminans]